jgi:DNA-binding CsgD family transcriptional regulator
MCVSTSLESESVKATPSESERIQKELLNRTRELNYLYSICELDFSQWGSLDELLNNLVYVIPEYLGLPELSCAKIILQDRTWKTSRCGTYERNLSLPIALDGEQVGIVVVSFVKEPLTASAMALFEEEQPLLKAITRKISLVLEIYYLQQEIAEMNTALKKFLACIEEEKREFARDVTMNVKLVLLPILQDLEKMVHRRQRRYVELLRSGLLDITSSFTSRIEEKFHDLTSTEIQICSLIRSGLRAKEIAELRNISTATVFRHREHIRRKLGLAHRRVNLATFLRSEFEPGTRKKDHILQARLKFEEPGFKI